MLRKLPSAFNVNYVGVFFFFSSRRRHTRCSRDWSSDVCSSDLFLRTLSAPRSEFRRSCLVICRALIAGLTRLFSCHRVSCWIASACGLSVESARSEEHTSELQSRLHLVCRLLLEKKKNHRQCMRRRRRNRSTRCFGTVFSASHPSRAVRTHTGSARAHTVFTFVLHGSVKRGRVNA